MRSNQLPQPGRPSLNPLTLAVASIIGASVALPCAQAQAVDEADDVVIVTASRRATSPLEVPFNVTVISGAELEGQRLTTLAEVARWVPGLTVIDQGARGSDLLTVRGLNTRSLNASEFLDNSGGNTVATYVGDIPLYLDLKMHDIQRVEFLSGPQGTLYGAGTLGGAIRYIPKAPDTEQFTVDFHGDLYDVSESNDPGYEADVVVNAPIVDGKLAFRGSVYYLDDPGFIDYPYLVREPGVSNPQPDFNDPNDVAANLYRADDVNTEQVVSSRLALGWDVNESIDATFNYVLQNTETGGRSVNHRASFGTGPYESGHRFAEPEERETSLFSVELVVDLGFAELTSATGVSTYDMQGQRDQTDFYLDQEWGYETFPSFVSYTRELQQEDRVNQEVRLVSTSSGPVGWIAGLFYNNHEFDSSSEEFTPGIPEFWSIDVPTGDLSFLQIKSDELTERAVFGELSFAATDRLEIGIGGRFFEYETSEFGRFELPFFAFAPPGETLLNEDDGFLGKLSLGYDVNDQIMTYFTASEGFRIGGANAVAPCPEPLPATPVACALPHEVQIAPDRTTNYEIGMHSAFNGGRVSLDAAVFRIDWEDVQTLGTTENGDVPITVNGGKARSQGLEVALTARGSGPWSVRTSYAYTDAKLRDDAPGLVDGADAFEGDRLSGTPKQQFSLLLRHQRRLANGWELAADYGVTATSDVLTKVGMRDNGERLAGFALHSASLALSKDRWSATLYADNLTNKFAETAVRVDQTSIRNVNGFDVRRYFRNVVRPRTVGLELRYSIGG
ncbi:MAG: TonB-dependent receptor [Gammaproteobacteria bacterium]|nr:TonB-dependent receptor [Gammaproteobacteria bacterium]